MKAWPSKPSGRKWQTSPAKGIGTSSTALEIFFSLWYSHLPYLLYSFIFGSLIWVLIIHIRPFLGFADGSSEIRLPASVIWTGLLGLDRQQKVGHSLSLSSFFLVSGKNEIGGGWWWGCIMFLVIMVFLWPYLGEGDCDCFNGVWDRWEE